MRRESHVRACLAECLPAQRFEPRTHRTPRSIRITKTCFMATRPSKVPPAGNKQLVHLRKHRLSA
jgi:hypothetical protein